MRLLTIFGTRPEIIRLSAVIERLDRLCEQVLVHTGQNFDKGLSEVFFRELRVREPDFHLGVRADGFAEQVSQILARCSEVMDRVQPDRVLLLGDTNSGLAAIVAARRGTPVFHMEAGNRCYDDRVPEEINRRIIDHCSAVLMPYTHRSKENLLREGIARDRIFVVGNPIYEVLQRHSREIESSNALREFGLQPRSYFLATMHRAENVDFPERLERLLSGLRLVSERHGLPMIISVHPHTASRIRRFGLGSLGRQVRAVSPLGFFDFVALEKNAICVLSDSGTVQEEACIFRVPNVTIRDVTERAETIEGGSSILSGADPEMVAAASQIALAMGPDWTVPPEYLVTNTSVAVCKIVLGHLHAGPFSNQASRQPEQAGDLSGRVPPLGSDAR